MRIFIVAVCLFGCGSGNTPPPMPDLSQPATADTWTNFAEGFFQSYCVSCHKPGGQGSLQDFAQLSQVMANSASIRCGVAPAGQKQSGCGASPAPGQFPIGNGAKPSDAERLRLVAWIDAGLPN